MTVATNTFREAVRDEFCERIFAAMMGAAILVGKSPSGLRLV
jgi:hypothetical protein